jgi:hypothetical protein
MTAEEQNILNNQSRLNALDESWAPFYQPGYINPEIDQREWNDLNQKFFGNGIYPGAKALAEEQYAGSSGFWGTPRANAVLNEYNASVIDPYRSIRSDMLQKSYQNALDYAANRASLNTTGAQIQALPRLIKQYGLDQKYNEWVRGSTERQNMVDRAINFLGLSTVSQTTTPGDEGIMGKYIMPLATAYLSGGASIPSWLSKLGRQGNSSMVDLTQRVSSPGSLYSGYSGSLY